MISLGVAVVVSLRNSPVAASLKSHAGMKSGSDD
jgi:hypothetical protein